MYEIPLFPLKTVLFPGMPLPLHIFEERYQEMIAYCIEENKPFGVVMIQEGTAEGGPLATPYAVGCTAEIAQVEPLEEGRMLIMGIGRERFRIVRLERGKPYHVGVVEPLSLDVHDESVLEERVAALRPLVGEYLDILSRTGNVDFDAGQIPTEPVALIYLAATLLQKPPEEKQVFLVMNDAAQLAAALEHAYRGEVAVMRWLPAADQGIFSLN